MARTTVRALKLPHSSLIKTKIREWSSFNFHKNYLTCPQPCHKRNSQIHQLQNPTAAKISPRTNHKLKSCTPLQATDDLTKLGLADEPTCPRCGGRDDSKIQYVLKCSSSCLSHSYRPDTSQLPNYCIKVSDQENYISFCWTGSQTSKARSNLLPGASGYHEYTLPVPWQQSSVIAVPLEDMARNSLSSWWWSHFGVFWGAFQRSALSC